jgi:hypothetical protein
MLKRWRLPQDNFPDDTETRAFQHYREGKAPPRFHFPELSFLRRVSWKIAGLGIAFIGVMLLGVVAVFMWSEPRERFVVVTGAPTAPADLPTIPIGGDFPTDAAQQFIRIPARIEDSLLSGQRRGYTFVAKPGFTWQIIVVPYENSGFDPVLSLYGPDGIIIDFNDNRVAGDKTAQIDLTVEREGVYAVLLEGAQGTGGGYILLVPVP